MSVATRSQRCRKVFPSLEAPELPWAACQHPGFGHLLRSEATSAYSVALTEPGCSEIEAHGDPMGSWVLSYEGGRAGEKKPGIELPTACGMLGLQGQRETGRG